MSTSSTKSINDVETPAFLVHLDKLIQSCEKMIQKVDNAPGVVLRPHIKTHKTIEGGLYQIEGAKAAELIKRGDHSRTDRPRKIVVSTLTEAQFFADSKEFDDILYAVPIGENKFDHAYAISSQIKVFNVEVDHITIANKLIEYAKKVTQPFKWNVYLKVDCGYGRCGAAPNETDGLPLAQLLHDSPYINFNGIYSHSGHSYNAANIEGAAQVAEKENQVMERFAELLREKGISVPSISVGATPSCCGATNWKGVSEVHPGNYIFYDRMQAALGSCTYDEVACSVLATVLSHYPDRNRLVIDAGALAFSKDLGNTKGGDWGTVRGHPNLRIIYITQEVGIIEDANGEKLKFEDYPIGSKMLIIPHHSCLTAANFPHYYVVDEDNQIKDVWKTCPRGW